MKVSAEELWKLNRDTAAACLAHPFLQGIASGDLSLERFRVYVPQDAYCKSVKAAPRLIPVPSSVRRCCSSEPENSSAA